MPPVPAAAAAARRMAAAARAGGPAGLLRERRGGPVLDDGGQVGYPRLFGRAIQALCAFDLRGPAHAAGSAAQQAPDYPALIMRGNHDCHDTAL
jgi:hypothetical protein